MGTQISQIFADNKEKNVGLTRFSTVGTGQVREDPVTGMPAYSWLRKSYYTHIAPLGLCWFISSSVR